MGKAEDEAFQAGFAGEYPTGSSGAEWSAYQWGKTIRDQHYNPDGSWKSISEPMLSEKTSNSSSLEGLSYSSGGSPSGKGGLFVIFIFFLAILVGIIAITSPRKLSTTTNVQDSVSGAGNYPSHSPYSVAQASVKISKALLYSSPSEEGRSVGILHEGDDVDVIRGHVFDQRFPFWDEIEYTTGSLKVRGYVREDALTIK
jgi:hypothetical protein